MDKDERGGGGTGGLLKSKQRERLWATEASKHTATKKSLHHQDAEGKSIFFTPHKLLTYGNAVDAATVLPRATLLSWYVLAPEGFPWSESKPLYYGSVEGGEDFSHCLTDRGYKARPFASKYDQHSALGVPGVSMGPTSLLSFLPSFIPLLLGKKKKKPSLNKILAPESHLRLSL